VAEVLLDPGCRVRPLAEPVPAVLAETAAGELFARLARTTDGAHHERARASALCALPTVNSATIERVVTRQAAELVGRTSLDHAVSAITVRVLAELLEMRDLDAAYENTMALVRGFRPTATAGDVDAASAAANDLGTRLEPAAIGLLIQSAEATAALIGNSIVALMRHPALLDDAASPGGARAVVQRTLEHDPPVHNTRRFLAADHLVAGAPMKTGDLIVVVLAATHGSTQQFGSGRHACPGSPLAVMIAASAVAWLAGAGRKVVAGATFAGYRPSVNVRSPLFVTRDEPEPNPG
jgi:hypothetical protein